MPAALIFNRFSNDGMFIRGFATPLYCCEYLDDGYTKHMDKLLIDNWKGYKLYVKELMKIKTSIRSKVIPLAGFIYRKILKTFKIVK